jgi:acetylornithine deacetylase
MITSPLGKEIVKRVDAGREEIIGFLQQLVAFDSVTGNEKPIQEFIARKLTSMGLRVDTWDPPHDELKKHPAYTPTETKYENRPNVVGIHKGKGGGRSLLFNGHVDVIPAEPLTAWRRGPWSGEVEEGRLYGRGASDMKSGLAAMTMAMDVALESGVRPKGDIVLEYVVDEELTGHGTLACVTKGYAADAGICCESSDLNVQPAAVGRMWFQVTLQGKPASITRRWEAISAIDKGYKICQAISELEQMRINEVKHPLYPDIRGAVPCSIGAFQSGSFPSATPDQCILKGSMATVPGEDPNAAKQQLIDHVLAVARTDPWLKDHMPQVRFYGLCAEPAQIAVDHPVCTTLASVFEEVTGRKANVSGREGAADTRFLIPYGKTPTVIFGPGTTAQMHATNEWVRVEDVIVATKCLALMIMDWCGFE